MAVTLASLFFIKQAKPTVALVGVGGLCRFWSTIWNVLHFFQSLFHGHLQRQAFLTAHALRHSPAPGAALPAPQHTVPRRMLHLYLTLYLSQPNVCPVRAEALVLFMVPLPATVSTQQPPCRRGWLNASSVQGEGSTELSRLPKAGTKAACASRMIALVILDLRVWP